MTGATRHVAAPRDTAARPTPARRRGASPPPGRLAAIFAPVATLDHEELLVRRGRRSGITAMVAVHSTARGPGLGGCRMWHYESPLLAVHDVLRLSRAMTYKAAVAGLAMGGGKGVIALPPGTPRPSGAEREAVLQDFADVVAALDGRYLTAEDVGTSDADMATIAGVTPHVTGLAEERGGSGDPSPWTALGVASAVVATVERRFGTTDLRGRSVAVVGLGSVGLPLAQLLAARGARLVVADIDPARRQDADALGARWTDPDAAMRAPVDVLAPCALGGVLDDDTIPALQAEVVVGAANNQLAEDRHADALHARGVLWAPDFVANAGGIINISVELEPSGYDREVARERVQRVGDTLRRIYDEADAAAATPLSAAMALAERRIADPASD